EHFEFKKPTRPASRGSLHFSSPDDEKDPLEAEQDLNTALTFSGGHNGENHPRAEIPAFPCRLSQQIADTHNDDGFLEMMDGPDSTNDTEMPSDMSCLWTAPLVVTMSEDLL
ncbi:M-phase inducer phosphatase 1-like, partial [Notechis scutatus]|uniref:M-phase inducer phosphatase 1-like n=1 Tax=Notechis scutatus TaxID=8663 RepID=A0A6J1W1X5_9SAUR